MASRRHTNSNASTSIISPNRGSSRYERHSRYYIESADLYLVAANVLFRVHGYFFSRESPIFHRRMNPSSPGDIREGSSEDDPVFLDDTPEEFEQLLWVFYNPRYSIYEGTLSQWNVILRLADKYNFTEVKDLAVREMHKKPELSVIEKMGLYQKYRVPERYLVPLYAELCERDEQLTEEEGEVLGARSVVLIGGMRERLRIMLWERKFEELKAKLEAAEQIGEEEADPTVEEPQVQPGKNTLEGMTREDVIAALEERLGIQAGTSIILEEGENRASEPSPSTPSTPSRRNTGDQPSRGSPKKKNPDISSGYVFID